MIWVGFLSPTSSFLLVHDSGASRIINHSTNNSSDAD